MFVRLTLTNVNETRSLNQEYYSLFQIEIHIFLMEIFFGLNIKHLRQTRNIKRDEFAAHFGMDITNLSKWEKGNHVPKVPDLIRVAQYFDVTIDDLLLKDLTSLASIAHEPSETYALKNERFAQEIDDLRRRMEEVERWRALEERKQNQKS